MRKDFDEKYNGGCRIIEKVFSDGDIIYIIKQPLMLSDNWKLFYNKNPKQKYIDWDLGIVSYWDEKLGKNVVLNPEFATKEQALFAKKYFDDVLFRVYLGKNKKVIKENIIEAKENER